jgi:hypothetical protein
LRGADLLLDQEGVGFCCFCMGASFPPHRDGGLRRAGGDVDRGVDLSYNGGGSVLLALSLSEPSRRVSADAENRPFGNPGKMRGDENA